MARRWALKKLLGFIALHCPYGLDSPKALWTNDLPLGKVVSPAKSIATDDFLKEFEVPATQDSLLEEAENVMPAPTRKRALRQTMARPAASEKKLGKKPEARPAASKKLGKKPACQEERLPDDWVMGDQALNFMTYKTGAVALRVPGGRQVTQLLSHKGKEHNNKLAKEALKMFKAGKTLGEVKAWESQAVKK